jgi:hypothetical protein
MKSANASAITFYVAGVSSVGNGGGDMRYRLSSAWRIGAVLCPAGTVIDASTNDYWSKAAKGKVIPINATPLDEEAWQAQLAAYQEHKHLKAQECLVEKHVQFDGFDTGSRHTEKVFCPNISKSF